MGPVEFNMTTFMLTKIYSVLLGFGSVLGVLSLMSLIIKKWDYTDIFKHDKITNGGLFACSIVIGFCIIVAFAVL